MKLPENMHPLPPIEAVREPAKDQPASGDLLTMEPDGYIDALASSATGVEARVCEDIAARQRLGIAKYGCTVEQSGDDMNRHAYEEALDLAIYLKAEIERRDRVCGWRGIADDLASALERLDALYRSEQDPEAPVTRPKWLRHPWQRYKRAVAVGPQPPEGGSEKP